METNKKQVWNNVCEVELIYRTKLKPSQRPQLNQPESVYEFLHENWDQDKIHLLEQAKAIYMNRANRVLGLLELSSGGISGTIIDPRTLFAAALKMNASCLILAHNHPSGTLLPSEQDIELTRKLNEAGSLLSIKIIDHLIITSEGYYSFSESGLL